MPVIPASQEVVGPTRAFAHGMNDTQEGDPSKAAVAIERALAADVTPLRLQLGADAIAQVSAHAETLLSDLRKWEPVARATAFASAPV
jgi:hypothetical protein